MMKTNSSPKPDRKTIEKARRDHMKSLYSHLFSLLPSRSPCSSSRDRPTLLDQIEEATKYIKKLQSDLEDLKLKRNNLLDISSNNVPKLKSSVLIIEVHEKGNALEVSMVTGLDLDCRLFNAAVRIVHEEGAEVVNASFSFVHPNFYHTIHAKIDEFERSQAAARIREKIEKFVLN